MVNRGSISSPCDFNPNNTIKEVIVLGLFLKIKIFKDDDQKQDATANKGALVRSSCLDIWIRL